MQSLEDANSTWQIIEGRGDDALWLKQEYEGLKVSRRSEIEMLGWARRCWIYINGATGTLSLKEKGRWLKV